MLTLALESSARAASAAIMRGDELLGQYYQNCGLTHSRTLLPMAEALMKNLDIKPGDIDLFAVSRGPGSFTGVRIGVAAVKGLAWALDKPVCGVSTLEAMAHLALPAGEGALVCCAMDARRSQLYNALFRIEGGMPRRLTPDRAIAAAELCAGLKAMGGRAYVLGDGAEVCAAALAAAGVDHILAPEPVRFQNAYGVARAAQTGERTDADGLRPVYLRLSQAERERNARSRSNGEETAR